MGELLHHNISSYGGGVDHLIWLITGFVVFWFAVSLLALIAFTLMSSRKEGVKALYAKGEGWSQTKWVMFPVILVTFCDAYIDIETSKVWKEVKGRVQDTKDFKKEDVLEVGIVAKQFGFDFYYAGPDGKLFTEDDYIEPNELHVPVGKKIVWHLTSLDVLHSFWVKNIRLKQDAIPGRFIIGWFQIEEEHMKTWAGDGWRLLADGENPAEGTQLVNFEYKKQRVEIIPAEKRQALGDKWAEADESKRKFEIACAEICGWQHGMMKSALIVHSQADFDKWQLHESTEAGEE